MRTPTIPVSGAANSEKMIELRNEGHPPEVIPFPHNSMWCARVNVLSKPHVFTKPPAKILMYSAPTRVSHKTTITLKTFCSRFGKGITLPAV